MLIMYVSSLRICSRYIVIMHAGWLSLFEYGPESRSDLQKSNVFLASARFWVPGVGLMACSLTMWLHYDWRLPVCALCCPRWRWENTEVTQKGWCWLRVCEIFLVLILGHRYGIEGRGVCPCQGKKVTMECVRLPSPSRLTVRFFWPSLPAGAVEWPWICIKIGDFYRKWPCHVFEVGLKFQAHRKQ